MKKYNKPNIQIYNVSLTDSIALGSVDKGPETGAGDNTFSKGTGSGSNMWEYMDED